MVAMAGARPGCAARPRLSPPGQHSERSALTAVRLAGGLGIRCMHVTLGPWAITASVWPCYAVARLQRNWYRELRFEQGIGVRRHGMKVPVEVAAG